MAEIPTNHVSVGLSGAPDMAQPSAPNTASPTAPAQSSQAAPRGIDSFALKTIAIVAMTCNHAAWIFGGSLPGVFCCVLLALGGLTFPIMLFLLHVGYRHTRSVKNYAIRLLVFAAIAQLPYWLFLQHAANVLVTLLMCLAVFYFYDRWKADARFWLLFVGVFLASSVCDWGFMGPVMALILHTMQGQKKAVAYSALVPILADGLPMIAAFAMSPTMANLGLLLYPLVGCSATIPLLSAYNGQRGRPLKWFFYLYYPAHIAVLGCIKLALGL